MFLLSLPGVVGVGVGLREENEEVFDELAIRILVDDAEQVPDGLPTELGGVGVCVIDPDPTVPDPRRGSP